MVKVPKVSVLIPCYNSEKYISATLDSVLHQTWANLEIIVIDDGSADESFTIAKSYAAKHDCISVYQIPNSGACIARNKAFELSKGDFIQFLDADDLICTSKITNQIEKLKSNPEGIITCIWGKFFTEKPEEDLIKWNLNPTNQDEIKPIEWLISDFSVALHSWLIPRKLVELTGGWNEKLLKNQDGEFMTRIIALSKVIYFDDKSRVYYRANVPNSITSNINKNKIISSYIGCETYESTLLGFGDNKQIHQAIANRYLMFCYIYGILEKDCFNKSCRKYTEFGPGTYQPFQSKLVNLIGGLFGYLTIIKIREGLKAITK